MTNSKIEFESFIKAHWSQEDKANAEAALTFVQQIMNDHNFDAIRDRFKGKNYKQHNRNIADGIEGVIKTMSDLVKNAPEFSYDAFLSMEHTSLCILMPRLRQRIVVMIQKG